MEKKNKFWMKAVNMILVLAMLFGNTGDALALRQKSGWQAKKGGKIRKDLGGPIRGADRGFITKAEHNMLRQWLEESNARRKEYRRQDLEEKYGFTIYEVPDLPVRDHYAIRDEILYVRKGEHSEEYAAHAAFELIKIIFYGFYKFGTSQEARTFGSAEIGWVPPEEMKLFMSQRGLYELSKRVKWLKEARKKEWFSTEREEVLNKLVKYLDEETIPYFTESLLQSFHNDAPEISEKESQWSYLDGYYIHFKDPKAVRGADRGFMSKADHEKMRAFLQELDARNEKFARHDLEDEFGVRGEIRIQAVSGMYKETGYRGHYAIRDNIVYIDEETLNGPYGKRYTAHEIDELRSIRQYATERGWTLDKLVDWLDNGDIFEVARLLRKAHYDAQRLPAELTEEIIKDSSDRTIAAAILRDLLEIAIDNNLDFRMNRNLENWSNFFLRLRAAELAAGDRDYWLLNFTPIGEEVALLYMALYEREFKQELAYKDSQTSLQEAKRIFEMLDTNFKKNVSDDLRPVRGAGDKEPKSSRPVDVADATMHSLTGGGRELEDFLKDAKDKVKEGALVIGAKAVLENAATLSMLKAIRATGEKNPNLKIAVWARNDSDVKKLQNMGIENTVDIFVPDGFDEMLDALEDTYKIYAGNIILINSITDIANITEYGGANIFKSFGTSITLDSPEINKDNATINLMPFIFTNAIARLSPDELKKRYKEFLVRNLDNENFSVSEEARRALANVKDSILSIPLATTQNAQIIDAQKRYYAKGV